MAKYKKNHTFDHKGNVGKKKYSYSGTLVTGTSTTAKKFAKSGLPEVKKGDTYLNTSTGCHYTCTEGGKASAAKWKYAGCRRIGKPQTGITGLKLVRAADGSLKMTASWSVPDALLAKKAGTGKTGRCATGLRRRWKFDTSAAGAVNILDKEDTADEANTSATENVGGFAVGTGAKAVKYSRASFHPHPGKPKLYGVTFWVDPYNPMGDGGKTADGKSDVAKSTTYKFDVPRVPSVSALSFDAETGVVSGTITTDPGKDARERLWTEWEVKVTDTSRPKASQTWTHASNAKDAATSRSFSYNAANYQSLAGGQYIRVHARARARGLAGDSAWTGWASYYVAFPKAATIEPSGRKVTVTSKGSNGKVTVPIAVNATTEHPVDRVKLQKLANVPYAAASAIPGDADWQDTGSVDDGRCTALVADVADLMPDRGNHTWIRVKSWHGSEESLHTYSAVREMRELFVAAPSASDDECAIARAKPLTGGTAAQVVVAYDGKGMGARDDATGTVLEWSDDPDAWTSTEEPDRFELTWRDSKTDASASAKYYYSQTVKVKGLDEGTDYWFRARRYMDDPDRGRSYGPYSNKVKVTTASVPGEDEGAESAVSAVALKAPDVVEPGHAVELSWTVASTVPQQAWSVLASGGQTLAAGSGQDGACTLPWERVEPYVSDGRLSVRVRVSAGGEYAESPQAAVAVAERPSLRVLARTLEAQPLSFDVESDVPAVQLSYTVRADGCSGDSPSGGYVQASGDVVAGGAATVRLDPVAWEGTVARELLAAQAAQAAAELEAAEAALAAARESGSGEDGALAAAESARERAQAAQAELEAGGRPAYRAAVTLDPGLEFHDGAGYTVEAVAADPSTGLRSEAASCGFDVAWAHKAPMPPETVEAVPAEDGSRSVSIALRAPEGAAEGDVYDVYRVTHDGTVRVSRPQGLPLVERQISSAVFL